ncbi:MAG TPA: type II secretion system protein F [Actinobacteria bacterium]|nr:type II secretion system protein F [Actinomycetota bacterium]
MRRDVVMLRTSITVTAAALAAAFPPAPSTHPPTSAPAPSPAVAAQHAGGVSWGLIAALAAVFAALLLVGLIGVSSLYQQDRHRALADQIGRYGPRHAPAQAGEEGRVASTVIGLTGQLLRSSNSERGLTQRLDLAGISRTPAEWVVLGGSGCVVLAVVLTLLTGNVLVGVLAGAVAGWLAMRLVLNIRTGRRRGAFGEQLPDLLQLIAASLQSGFSLPQALDGVVQENTQPAAGEFSRALTEARIGADLEDALDGVANRMNSDDLRWTVMAIRIQRQVGGNLAEVLQNTVGTMRERAYLRRQVRALSAEARLSAYILSVLPPLVGCWLLFIDPTYMRPLYTTLAGLLLLAVTVVLYVVGVLWMRKVIRVVV